MTQIFMSFLQVTNAIKFVDPISLRSHLLIVIDILKMPRTAAVPSTEKSSRWLCRGFGLYFEVMTFRQQMLGSTCVAIVGDRGYLRQVKLAFSV